MKNAIYLDYNATAPTRSEVITAMTDAMKTAHNASSQHQFGRQGREIIENARDQIGKLVKLPSSQIIFNSGATEGNNTVLYHFAKTYPNEIILVSAIEHPSVLDANVKTVTIPVNENGIVDVSALETLLKDHKTSLVSVMYANNETGIIQPITEISAITHKHGALLHVDAVQAAGRIRVDMQTAGIDFLTLSAHKIGGPQGVGTLCLGLCGISPTLLYGGGQEKSLRAGTQNTAGIAGFGVAAALALQGLIEYQNKTTDFQTQIETALTNYNGVKVFGQNAERLSNTTLISLPGLSSETLLIAFDIEGIALSNGSACSSGKVEPSHVLKAMGESNTTASSALRISTGWNTAQNDIDTFITIFDKIYTRMRHKIQS